MILGFYTLLITKISLQYRRQPAGGTGGSHPLPQTSFSLSRELRASTGGDIQRGDGGQRGVSVSTYWRRWWSYGTWATGTGRRTRHGTRDSHGKDDTVVGRAEPHVSLPDARARVPGEISLPSLLLTR